MIKTNVEAIFGYSPFILCFVNIKYITILPNLNISFCEKQLQIRKLTKLFIKTK